MVSGGAVMSGAVMSGVVCHVREPNTALRAVIRSQIRGADFAARFLVATQRVNGAKIRGPRLVVPRIVVVYFVGSRMSGQTDPKSVGCWFRFPTSLADFASGMRSDIDVDVGIRPDKVG